MLNQLLPEKEGLPEITISGIEDDSRKVSPGDLFIAVPGLTTDGRQYIKEVESRQAAGVLCESPAPEIQVTIPVVEVDDLASMTGDIASRFYGTPSADMLVVAVTGTNGKTSCSHFISRALTSAGLKCGVVGTMGYGMPDALSGAGLTTPPAVRLQRYLAELRDEKCRGVVLEASSHGLEQGRLNGTRIDIAVFTNITRDHLDYHESFEHYGASKKKLFQWPGLQAAILNRDDPFAGEITKLLAETSDTSIVTTSIVSDQADVYCRDIRLTEQGLGFLVCTPWGEARIRSSLMGRFNISNLLSAIAVLGIQGFALNDIVREISSIGAVRGRMEMLRYPGRASIIIDYAHTPDALEKALQAIREHCKGELWCVFGCGGDRDKGKRSLMGEIASRLADHVVITDDNPRSEPSMAIARDVVKGVVPGSDVEIETNRRLAIRKVMLNAAKRDVILLAGKGHEAYQEVSGRRLPFSDHAIVHEFISQGG